MSQDSPSLIASDARWPYPETPAGWRPFDPAVQYCGPEGSRVFSRVLGKRVVWVDTNRACWAHDERYRHGKTEEDRETADRAFLADQYAACEAAYGPLNPLRYLAKRMCLRRYLAVRVFGVGPFWAGKPRRRA